MLWISEESRRQLKQVEDSIFLAALKPTEGRGPSGGLDWCPVTTDRAVENGAAAVALWNGAADAIDAKFGKGFFGLRLRYITEDQILAQLRRGSAWDDPTRMHLPRPKPRISAQRVEPPVFNGYTIRFEETFPGGGGQAIAFLKILCRSLIHCEVSSLPTPPRWLTRSQLDEIARARKHGSPTLPGARQYGMPIWRWMSRFLTTALSVPEKDIQHQASARDGYYNTKLRKRKYVIDLRRRVIVQEQGVELEWGQDYQQWKLLKDKIENGFSYYVDHYNEFARGIPHHWSYYLCTLTDRESAALNRRRVKEGLPPFRLLGGRKRFTVGGRTYEEAAAPTAPLLRGIHVPFLRPYEKLKWPLKYYPHRCSDAVRPRPGGKTHFIVGFIGVRATGPGIHIPVTAALEQQYLQLREASARYEQRLPWQDHRDCALVGAYTVDLPKKLVTEATVLDNPATFWADML